MRSRGRGKSIGHHWNSGPDGFNGAVISDSQGKACAPPMAERRPCSLQWGRVHAIRRKGKWRSAGGNAVLFWIQWGRDHAITESDASRLTECQAGPSFNGGRDHTITESAGHAGLLVDGRLHARSRDHAITGKAVDAELEAVI